MRCRRDDRGAVALVVGLLAAVLLSVAAMAVDLGSAYVARQDVQHTVDFATLAGAAANNLPGTTPGACPYGKRAAATDQAVQDVAAYLGSKPWTDGPDPASLVDCSIANGEVLYGTVARSQNAPGIVLNYDPYELTVLSPQHRVDFAMAEVMGFSGVDVQGRATVAIESPGVTSVPLYAFTGCDYGRQTIAQPNNGHAADLALASPNDHNAAMITSLLTSPATTPVTIPIPAPAPSPLTINGTGFANVTAVGFFEPGPGALVTVPSSDFASRSATSIQLADVPAGVTSVSGDWYVRVKIGGTWSAVPDDQTMTAMQLTVGDPTLTCGQGSSEGNFGSLQLSNTLESGQWQQIAMNIAAGLQHALAVSPSPAADWTCGTQQNGTVMWPQEGTNCVATKTGMIANAAQAGFVDGIGGHPGRLAVLNAGTGCDPSGTPAQAIIGGKVINNDTLSCFLTDDTTNIGAIDSATYSGAPVLSPRIYASPRFMMIPVLGTQPTTGGSKSYEIVGFRPAFLTDQPNSATRTSPPTASNGLTLRGNSIESVQVVFINARALPPMEAAQSTPYSGSGPRVVRLID